jgi:hypothetical protein
VGSGPLNISNVIQDMNKEAGLFPKAHSDEEVSQEDLER